MRTRNFSRASFTLIELLLVIGVTAVLSTVVLVVINPAELLKQARDSQRLNDLYTLNKALAIREVGTQGTSGSSSTVYISIPDTSPTCANLGLLALPPGWSWGCVPSSTLRNIDGTGWIPLDLTTFASGPPITKWPIDPVNATSSGHYYAYVTGGSWKLAGNLESKKRALMPPTDGGRDPTIYEVGSDLTLAPFTHGLFAYWNFDEGAGFATSDKGGYGYNGTLTGSPAWANGKENNALSFNGPTDDYISTSDISSQDWSSISITFWAKWDGTTQSGYAGAYYKSGGNDIGRLLINGSGGMLIQNGNGNFSSNSGAVPVNQWAHIAYVYDQSAGKEFIYVNGVNQGQQSRTGNITQNTDVFTIGRGFVDATYSYGGIIDEMRIYRRALSETQIKSIYDATK